MYLDRNGTRARFGVFAKFVIIAVTGCALATNAQAQVDPPATTTDNWSSNAESATPAATANPEASSGTQPSGTASGQCGCPIGQQAGSEVASIVAANLDEPKKICPAVAPLIAANPCAAADLIAAAAQYSQLSEQLAQCLSTIQNGFMSTIPQSAETIEKVVSCASPSFQAAYAEALAPTDPNNSGDTGSQAAAGGDGGGASSSGTGGTSSSGSGFGTLGGGTGQFGANPISPN